MRVVSNHRAISEMASSLHKMCRSRLKMDRLFSCQPGARRKSVCSRIRAGRPEEAAFLGSHIEAEGWDGSMYDITAQLTLDPNCLLVAADDNNRPVGFGMSIQCAKDVVYMDNLIVLPEARGQGIGRNIWTAMVAQGGSSNIILDGVPAMVDWYRRQGFVHPGVDLTGYTMPLMNTIKQEVTPACRLELLSEEHWPEMMRLDRAVYPSLDRERVLRAFFVGRGVKTLVALDGRRVVGFGSIHEKRDGFHGLRNVTAENEKVADYVIRGLLSHLSAGSTVSFRVPSCKRPPRCFKNAEKGMTVTRLYSKSTIDVITDKLFVSIANIV
ncbi:hypothetical protein MAR_025125 [Mya arenaria]|uniref:N-acetyltransferase domain-containing protein n=1 Tax=Mya arenaria TaxID=6604 RepID=A0ABY7DSR9_MYAAR|nr:uncharacterized protein LOC128229250 [Mya arenaria]WAR00753.1 hypothetical protein MAR_025125 [Mya arenaria]